MRGPGGVGGGLTPPRRCSIIPAPGGGSGVTSDVKPHPPLGATTSACSSLLLFRHLVASLCAFGERRLFVKKCAYTHTNSYFGSLKCYGTIPNTLTSYMRALLAERLSLWRREGEAGCWCCGALAPGCAGRCAALSSLKRVVVSTFARVSAMRRDVRSVFACATAPLLPSL